MVVQTCCILMHFYYANVHLYYNTEPKVTTLTTLHTHTHTDTSTHTTTHSTLFYTRINNFIAFATPTSAQPYKMVDHYESSLVRSVC